MSSMPPLPRSGRGPGKPWVDLPHRFRPKSHEFGFAWSCAQSPPGLYSYDIASGQKNRVGDASSSERETGGCARPSTDPIPDVRRQAYTCVRPSSGGEVTGPFPVMIAIHGGPSNQSRPRMDFSLTTLAASSGSLSSNPTSGAHPDTGNPTTTWTTASSAKEQYGTSEHFSIGSRCSLIWTPRGFVVAGGSYGGYMALSAAVLFGDRLRGCIDLSGISSFESYFMGTRASDLDLARLEFGDERNPETRRFLRSISPLSDASRIRKPLLVVHGANDPRVPVLEAERIVSAVRRNGVPVWYIRFENEGHAYRSWEHEKYEYEAQILFLMALSSGKTKARIPAISIVREPNIVPGRQRAIHCWPGRPRAGRPGFAQRVIQCWRGRPGAGRCGNVGTGEPVLSLASRSSPGAKR